MTEQDLFDFYQTHFKLIYGDVVAVTGKKHLEIDGQIESAMSHLAFAKTSNDEAVRIQNIDAAYDHIGRACLDAAKLLWINRWERVDEIFKNELLFRWCLNVPSAQAQVMRTDAENLARTARRNDAMQAGHSKQDLVEQYHAAASACEDIIGAIDPGKAASVRKFKLWYIAKEQFVGFVFGIIAATLVSLFVWKYLPVECRDIVVTPAVESAAKRAPELPAPKK